MTHEAAWDIRGKSMFITQSTTLVVMLVFFGIYIALYIVQYKNIGRSERKIMAAIDDLQKGAADEAAAVAGVGTALTALADRLRNNPDPDAATIEEVATGLEQSATTLGQTAATLNSLAQPAAAAGTAGDGTTPAA